MATNFNWGGKNNDESPSSNYYTKSEIDNKINTINDELNNKQNILTAGTNINIEDNVINCDIDLSNCVMKNQTNNITSTKLITTSNVANTIFEISADPEKKMYFDFIQDRNGYRNWNHLIFRTKVANNDYVNILDAYSQGVNEGLFLATENNKVTFANPTLIGGVDTPVGDNDAANKAYVDDKVANITQPEINLMEGVETAIPNYKINGKQVYKMYCTTNDQITNLLNSVDYVSISGLALNTINSFISVPCYNQNISNFYIIGTTLSHYNMSTTGHKVIVEYTKK